MHGKSCETMANDLEEAISEKWDGRGVKVSVFEDGEVGAIVSVS